MRMTPAMPLGCRNAIIPVTVAAADSALPFISATSTAGVSVVLARSQAPAFSVVPPRPS